MTVSASRASSANHSESTLASRREVIDKVAACFDDAFAHDGYADITLSLRIRRRGEKECIVAYGKEWRFVLPCPTAASSTLTPPTTAIRRPGH